MLYAAHALVVRVRALARQIFVVTEVPMHRVKLYWQNNHEMHEMGQPKCSSSL